MGSLSWLPFLLMPSLEEITFMAIKNMKVVRLYKTQKFRDKFTPFLLFYLEEAYEEGYYHKPIDKVLKLANIDFLAFKTAKNHNDFTGIEVILNKWLILAYNEGEKENKK